MMAAAMMRCCEKQEKTKGREEEGKGRGQSMLLMEVRAAGNARGRVRGKQSGASAVVMAVLLCAAHVLVASRSVQAQSQPCDPRFVTSSALVPLSVTERTYLGDGVEGEEVDGEDNRKERKDIDLFDYSFRDTFIPYPIYPIRLDPLRRPLRLMGSTPVKSGTMRVDGAYRFTMKVWYPSTLSPTSGCSPAVVILHPTQVFDARDGESEYQQTCEHFASLGVICFISLETEAQFGQRTTGRNARQLAERAFAMWNRVRKEGRTRGSPLYKAVCNRLAVSGYSMGSGSALIMAGTYTKPEDGIVALGYIHGTLVDPSFIENVEVPTLIGGGTADTLNSGDTYFLSFNTTVNRNPIMTVMLEGTPHVSGPCGNLCPVVGQCCRGTYFWDGHLQIVNGQFTKHTDWLIPFFLAYLFEDKNMARALWDANGQIDTSSRVHHVTRNARVKARAPTRSGNNSSINDDENGGNADEGKSRTGGDANSRASTAGSRPAPIIDVESDAQGKTVRLMEVSAFTDANGAPYELIVDSVTGSRSRDSICSSIISVEAVETPIMVGQDADALRAANEAAANAPEPEPIVYYSWGRRVELPPPVIKPQYAWSEFSGVYGRVSASCLPPNVFEVTCRLNMRVASVKDGATVSEVVTRFVRVRPGS